MPSDQALIRSTACAIVGRLHSGEITPLDLLDALETRIAEVDSKTNALPTLCFDRARANAKTLMQKLTTGSFQTPYYTQPLTVQKDGRQLNIPAFAAKIEKLTTPQYGVHYAVKVLFTMPPSEVVGSASSYGCHVSNP